MHPFAVLRPIHFPHSIRQSPSVLPGTTRARARAMKALTPSKKFAQDLFKGGLLGTPLYVWGAMLKGVFSILAGAGYMVLRSYTL